MRRLMSVEGPAVSATAAQLSCAGAADAATASELRRSLKSWLRELPQSSPEVNTAPTPADASPMPMLMLSPDGVQVTGPVTFCFCPSTMTCGPAGAAAVLEAPVPDLLLEQPAQPAATMAAPATPITIARFTAHSSVLLVPLPSRLTLSTPRDLPGGPYARCRTGRYPVPSSAKPPGAAQSGQGQNAQSPLAQQRLHEGEVGGVVVTFR